MKIIEKIENTLNKIRPFLRQDGGGVELVQFVDGIAYLRVLGACVDCTFQDAHINHAIEEILINEVPGVIAIKIVK